MSQARNHLQAVSPTGSQHQHAIVTNQLVKQYNRQDTDTFAPIYAADTGTGAAYAITPVPGVKFYVVGQIFAFMAKNTSTSTAPTLNVNGFGAGTITYPDGSALVVGDIVANGFYQVEVTSLTPTFQLLSAAGGRSKLLQSVAVLTPGVATGTTAFPINNSTPQNTGGDQYMSLAITPKSATSILQIQVTIFGSHSANTRWGVALFQDATANALASGTGSSSGLSVLGNSCFTYRMTSGTTSATTFKVRAGGASGATFTFNGEAGSGLFNSTLGSSIIITEEFP